VVVHGDDRGGAGLEGHLEDHPHVDDRSGEAPFGDLVDPQHLVGPVQKQDVEVLHVVESRPELLADGVSILGGVDLEPVPGRDAVRIGDRDLGY